MLNKKIKFFLPLFLFFSLSALAGNLAFTGKNLSDQDEIAAIKHIETNAEELLPTDQTKSIPKDMLLNICEYLPGDNKFVNEMVRAYPTNNNTYKNIAKKFIEKVIDIETEENINNLLDQYFKTSKINIKPKIKNEIIKALPEYLHLLIGKKAPLIQNEKKLITIYYIFNEILEDLKDFANLIFNLNNNYLQNLSKEEIISLKEKLEYNLKTCNILLINILLKIESDDFIIEYLIVKKYLQKILIITPHVFITYIITKLYFWTDPILTSDQLFLLIFLASTIPSIKMFKTFYMLDEIKSLDEEYKKIIRLFKEKIEIINNYLEQA